MKKIGFKERLRLWLIDQLLQPGEKVFTEEEIVFRLMRYGRRGVDLPDVIEQAERFDIPKSQTKEIVVDLTRSGRVRCHDECDSQGWTTRVCRIVK